MPHSLAVAVLGFSDFERQALTAAFRASQNQALSLRLAASEDEAALFVFDTDRAGAVEALGASRRGARTVCIGAHAPDDPVAWMMRPIDPAKVVLTLERIARREGLVPPDTPSAVAIGGAGRRREGDRRA